MASLPLLAEPELGYFDEDGPIEWLQWVMLSGSAALLCLGARRRPDVRESLLCCATLLALASIRELDSLFDRLIALGWQLPFSALFLAGGAFAVRHRAALRTQASELSTSVPGVLMWVAFLFVVPFAQLLGHGEFLRPLMGESYDTHFKGAIEEVCETVGYVLVLSASLEFRIWAAERSTALRDERFARRAVA